MKLFEFKLKRTYEDGSVKEKTFQVPAVNEMAALVNLGRNHPHPENNDYEIEVVSINQVGQFKAQKAREALVENILHHSFTCEDYSREHGLVDSAYEVSNLFTDLTEAKFAINKIIDAYEVVSRK